ncbi:MAG: hypothetical protein MUF00_11430 [Gemmatimonadaceae bacterium]|jgi:hypothetical protein|nr:hypothetical protein [Gemmatimonadaceae bacterium]
MARRLLAASLALWWGLAASNVWAQQTIINVPSVDQTTKGKFFALHESQIRAWDGVDYYQTTNFLTYGLTDRFELATTVYNVGSPALPISTVGLGWKTAQPILRGALPRWDVTVGAGQMLQLSMRGRGTGIWSYGQVAATVPASRTRVMVGVSDGPANLFGKHTTHLIASYEQPIDRIIPHVSLLGEWWAGTHEFGDFVPGINYHTKSWVVILGYKISNKPGSRTDGVILEFGKTF